MQNTTEIKGRAEQAVGDLTDDEQMKREGEVDKKAGKVKEKIDDAVERVKEVLHHN